MNCVNHPEVTAAAYCRTCGKALCEACKRNVRGAIYCEECIASRLGNAVPPPIPQAVQGAAVQLPVEQASPGLAAILGFIPGVGAMYNGQFVKGLIHVVIFATLIWIASHGGGVIGGLLIPFFILYMVIDAYKTARAREMGQPLPDPFGFDRLFGVLPPAEQPRPTVQGFAPPGTPPPAPGAVPPASVQPGYAVDSGCCPPVRRSSAPAGAVILIILGVLFLLHTAGWWHFYWFGRFWPLVLIALGIWLLIRRMGIGSTGAGEQ